MNFPPDDLAARIFAPGRLPPVVAREDAMKRVRYGLFALTETPAGGGQTSADRVGDDAVFRAALHAVERFLDLGKWPEPGRLYEQVRDVCDGLGLGDRGPSAAGLGVLLLVRAVEQLHADPPDLAGAARLAEAAAAQATRSGDVGHTADSLNYLERLQIRMYHLPHIPRPNQG